MKHELDRLRQELAAIKRRAEPADAELMVNAERSTVEAKTSKNVAAGETYVDEIVEAAKEVIHPKIRPLDIFRAYAESETTISEMQFILACSKIGVTFDELASAVLVSRLKKSEAGVEYVDFAAALKGSLFQRLIDEELYQLGESVAGMNLSHKELMRRFVSEAQEDRLIGKEAIEQGVRQLSKGDFSKEAEYVLRRVKSAHHESMYDAHKLVELIEKAQKVCLVEAMRAAARETKTDLVNLFAMLDKNDDRRLERTEFEKLARELGVKILTGTNLELAMEVFDPKQSGRVEFATYCEQLLITAEQRKSGSGESDRGRNEGCRGATVPPRPVRHLQAHRQGHCQQRWRPAS